MIALKLRYQHIDTGAMYRAVAWKAGELGLNLADPDAVAAMAEKLDIKLFPGETGQKILVDGEDVTARLKTEAVGKGAATVAAQARVREILVAKQRAIGKNGGVVMDGRDIGTVVFPEADRKFFLDADPRERGRRRYEELKAANNPGVDLEAIIRQVIERDQEDRNRAVSPLKQADDAVLVDTTHLAIEDVVQRMIDMILPP